MAVIVPPGGGTAPSISGRIPGLTFDNPAGFPEGKGRSANGWAGWRMERAMNLDRRRAVKSLAAPLLLAAGGAGNAYAAPMERSTAVSIQGNAFHINGRPTYPGRVYNGSKVEGLLFAS